MEQYSPRDFDDCCEFWADGLYSDEQTRNGLVNSLQIVHTTDGNICFNEHQALSFVQFLASSGSEEGINWSPETTEQDKLETCMRVMGRFLSLVAASNHHLLKFSIN